MKIRDTDPAERVLDYLTTLARDQDVHVVTLDAIIGACDIRPLKWPELLNKLADKVEAAPGRDAYRLRKKRDLMARLTDEERVVGHLLKGPASPAEIRQALNLADSDTKAILQSLAVTGRAQHDGRGRGVRWSLVETGPQPPPVEATPMVEERAPPSTPEVEAIPEEQPQGSAALRKAVADHVGMSELASDGDLLEGLETMRAIGAAEHMAVQAAAAQLEAAVATEHEFRAIARALGLGLAATAGEIAEAVRAVGAERDALRDRLRLAMQTEEGQAAAAQLEGKRLEVLDRSRAHADMVEAVTRALGGDTDEPMSDEALVALARMTWESLPRLAAERDEARAQRNEARGQRDAVERRAEATNDALRELRKKARRKLERARHRLADAQNGLDIIEAVPLADDGIPFGAPPPVISGYSDDMPGYAARAHNRVPRHPRAGPRWPDRR